MRLTTSCKQQVKTLVDEMLDKVPDEFNIQEMMARTEDRSPYTIVAFQECERMNLLMKEIKRSLRELSLGLKVITIIFIEINSHGNVNRNKYLNITTNTDSKFQVHYYVPIHKNEYVRSDEQEKIVRELKCIFKHRGS